MRTSRRTPTDGAQPSTAQVRGRRAHAGPPADEDSGPEETDDTESGNAPPRATNWSLRPRTVRAKIVCLLMVPVVSLLALWAHTTVTTAQDVARLRQLQRVDSEVRAPVATAVIALQDERVAAVRYATRPSADRERALKKLAARTDRTVSELRLGAGSTVADSEELPPGVAARLESFVTNAEQLPSLRTAVLDRRTGWEETHRRYTGTIASAFGVGGALTGIQDAEIGSDARVLLEFSRAGRPWRRRTRYSPVPASPGPSTDSGCGCSPARSTRAGCSPAPPSSISANPNEPPGRLSRRVARTPT